MRNSYDPSLKYVFTRPILWNGKQMSALSNITQTIFPDGGYFSEVVGKRKDLLKALDIELPESEMNVVYEEDENAQKAEDYVDD